MRNLQDYPWQVTPIWTKDAMASEVHEHLVSGIVHAAKSRDPSTSHEAVNVVWQDMQPITLDEAADYWTYCLDVDPVVR